MSRQLHVATLAAICAARCTAVGLGCLDETGAAVDSWVALAANADYQYYWHSTTDGFVRSKYRTNQTNAGCIMNTVNQLYSSDLDMTDAAYALYSDQPPPDKSESSSYAHSKGVMMASSAGGFWLVHSKPNWPNGRDSGAVGFPDSTYSQSLMCITMDPANIDAVAATNIINYPYIYDSYISDSLVNLLPNFSSWIKKTKTTVQNSTTLFTSRGGVEYTQFAKSGSWGKDLYDDFVAPYFGADINVETWRDGSGGRMGSICEGADDDTWGTHTLMYSVLEVSLVSMPDGLSWSGTQDHSKWLNSVENNFFCIGDINRMCSQESRGGGTVCQKDSTLWNSFNKIIFGTEGCWSYDPCAQNSTHCYWCSSTL